MSISEITFVLFCHRTNFVSLDRKEKSYERTQKNEIGSIGGFALGSSTVFPNSDTGSNPKIKSQIADDVYRGCQNIKSHNFVERENHMEIL